MPPRRQAAGRDVRSRLSDDAAAVHAQVIRLAKRADAEGGLRDLPESDTNELQSSILKLNGKRLDGVDQLPSQLDEHGTLEFWAATFSVHAYALRDYCAIHQDLQQLLEQRHARRGGVDQEETPAFRRLARLLERMATLVSYFATIMSSCDGFTMGSMGSERRVLALLRADTLKVYAAVFDTVARGQLSGSTAENAAMTCGTLLQVIPECTGVHNVPCNSSDDFNLKLYSEFVKAAAESHVLEHACRVLLRLSEGAATAAQTPAEREEHFPAFLALSRMALNKAICRLVAPLAMRQSVGALHPRPLAAPRTGTDPALLALLPAVRGLLSGTGVQLWVAKQLLDVANVVPVAETAAAGQEPKGYTGVAAAAGAVTADASRYLGLPPTARTPPHLLSYVMLGSSIHDEEAGLPDAKGAAIALRMALDIARTVWQITISGPLAPVMVVPGVPIGGSAGSRGSATAACSAAGGSVAGGSAAGGSSAGGSAAGGSAAGVGSAKGASAAASPGAGGGAARVSVARSSSAGGSRAGGGLVAGARAAVGTSAVGAPGPGGGANAVAGGSDGGGAAGASSLYRLPSSIPLSPGQVCALIVTILDVILKAETQKPASSGLHAQDEMASIMALACRLAAELQPQSAPAILSRLWRTARSWLLCMPAHQGRPTVKHMLPPLGSLLLHEYAGESESRLQRAIGGGPEKDDNRTVAFTAALRAGFVELLTVALEGSLDLAAAGQVAASGVPYLAELLLRRSCVLPPLLAYGDSARLMRLLEVLRVGVDTVRDQSHVGGRGALETEAFAIAAGDTMQVLVELLEHVAAVCMRAPPEGLASWVGGAGSSSSSSSSSSGGSAGCAAGGAAAGAGCLPGQPIPNELAAAIDRTAAALLTKGSRQQVPKQRLRRMWLMAHNQPGAQSFAVLALSRLLPTLFQLRRTNLSEAGVPKDLLLGITRVFMAAALQLLRVVVALAAGSSCATPRIGAGPQAMSLRHARARSWHGLLMAEEGVVLTWVAAVLTAATKRQWPEGHAAALDLLEVLVLTLPPQDLASHVKLQTAGGAGVAAQEAPSQPSLPLALSEGWLAQQGRGKLLAALKERGCPVLPGADGGSSSRGCSSRGAGGGSSSDAAGGGSWPCWYKRTEADQQLIKAVTGQHSLELIPEVPAPMEALWLLQANLGIEVCARPGCSQFDLKKVTSSQHVCEGCAVAAYCSSECKGAHAWAGHFKAECACMQEVREVCASIYRYCGA